MKKIRVYWRFYFNNKNKEIRFFKKNLFMKVKIELKKKKIKIKENYY
jgi:hypothetical protein